MSKTSQRAGYLAELEASSALRAMGYEVARSAASKGPFDLIAFDEKVVRFIQVKLHPSSSPHPTKAERAAVAKVRVPKGCQKELWVKRRGDGWNRHVIEFILDKDVAF